jgi:hypothetical protein
MLAHNSEGELLAIAGPKDGDGNLLGISAVTYEDSQGDRFAVTIGPDGLPVGASTGTGWVFVFSNYSESSVDVFATDPDEVGTLYPAVPFDSSMFSELSDYAESGIAAPNSKTRSVRSAERMPTTHELFDIARLDLSIVGCRGNVLGVLFEDPKVGVPRVILSCTGTLLSTHSYFTGNELTGLAASTISLGLCFAGSPLSCASLGLKATGFLYDVLDAQVKRCSYDPDFDGLINCGDNCATVWNPDQTDADHDLIGDACDRNIIGSDLDGDGVPDIDDNCLVVTNPNQNDSDGDGVGDACDPDTAVDTDGDGWADSFDNCPQTPNPTQSDSDNDGWGNACDGCPSDPNKTALGQCGCGKVDTPNCGQPVDNCPSDPNKSEPGVCGCGVADTDSDGDGTSNCHDLCPNDPNKTFPGACGCGTVDTPNCGQSTSPDPDLVSVSGIPSSVQAGQSFTVTVTARNDGGTSSEGGINASVLYSDGSDNVDATGPTGSGFDQLLNRSASHYPIYNSSCNAMTAQDRLIEAVDANWTNGEQHTMSFTVTPQQAGTFWVRVRTTMAADVPSCYYRDDTSVSGGVSDTDQQGWTVRRFAVTVPSTSPNPDLVSVSGIPSSVQAGLSFTVTVTARNDGGTSSEGGINASVLYSDGSDNVDVTGPTGTGFDQLLNRPPGYNSIYNSSCNAMTAQDRLIEAVDANWTNGEQHTMSFTVTPQQAGTFWVRVRTTMAADVPSCYYRDDTSVSGGVSDTDQQGWTVRRFAVTVNPSAVTCCTGTCSCPGSALPIPNPTTNWQTYTALILSRGWSSKVVQLIEGREYTFKTGCENGATGEFDTVIELYDWDSCMLIACNDDACSTLSSVTFTAAASGEHVVKVRGFDEDEFGNFTISYRQNP